MEVTPITVNYFFGVNSYLVKTDNGYFLIDTGITKKRGQLEKQLNEAGCRPGDLKLIIITTATWTMWATPPTSGISIVQR